MKEMKRILALCLAVVCTAGVLSGCGQKPEDSTETLSETENTKLTEPTELVTNDTEAIADTTETTENFVSDPQISVGFVQDGIWQNEYFDVFYTVDTNWSLYTDEILRQENNLAQNIQQIDLEQQIERSGEVLVMGATGPDDAQLCVYIEQAGPSDVRSVLYYMKQYFEEAARDGTIVLSQCELSTISFCGGTAEYLATAMSAPDSTTVYYGRRLAYTKDDYTMTVSVSAEDEMIADACIASFSGGTSDKSNQSVAAPENKPSGEAAIKGTQYNLAALPGTLTISDIYNVYSMDSGYTEEMCRQQGIEKAQMDQYLALAGDDMIILPENGLFGKPEFQIMVRIKAEDYGITDMKLQSDAVFDQIAKTLVAGYAEYTTVSDYTAYENSTAKYVVFEYKLPGLSKYQRRYATVINGKMVYFIAETSGDAFTPEQDVQIQTIIDTLTY